MGIPSGGWEGEVWCASVVLLVAGMLGKSARRSEAVTRRIYILVLVISRSLHSQMQLDEALRPLTLRIGLLTDSA